MTSKKKYLPHVKKQYEEFPYPPRNPEHEKIHFSDTETDLMSVISHFGYQGKLDVTKGLRCLVAGGGTGDGTLHLAEQLRETPSEIIHLDLSRTSMKIAQERAKIRGLTNITWINDSILNIPNLNLGEFDYINSIGVLHHLENPSEGLNMLKGVLAPKGVMGIMVYGRHARAGVYQMQEMMRMVNAFATDSEQEVDNARAMWDIIPKSHTIKKQQTVRDEVRTDSGLYDIFLHSQDRPYSVLEVYEWVEKEGLRLISFTGLGNGGRVAYQPEYCIANPDMLAHIKTLPERYQQGICEVMLESHMKHQFYLTHESNKNTVAAWDDMDNVPTFLYGVEMMQDIGQQMIQNPDVPIQVRNTKTKTMLDASIFRGHLLARVGAQTSLGDIYAQMKALYKEQNLDLTQEIFLKEVELLAKTLHTQEMMHLRHKSVAPYITSDEIRERLWAKHPDWREMAEKEAKRLAKKKR